VHVCVLHCFAVFCSVLQCVAVCCSELQCVAVCCSVLQEYPSMSLLFYIFICCLRAFTLQCVAACHSVLQCVAVCSSMSQCAANIPQHVIALLQLYCPHALALPLPPWCASLLINSACMYVAVCCSVLQCVAVC